MDYIMQSAHIWQHICMTNIQSAHKLQHICITKITSKFWNYIRPHNQNNQQVLELHQTTQAS